MTCHKLQLLFSYTSQVNSIFLFPAKGQKGDKIDIRAVNDNSETIGLTLWARGVVSSQPELRQGALWH